MTKVLIVDDDPNIRQILKLTLATFNCETIWEAENGSEAIDLARQKQPDLIMLDVGLPGEIDGFEVCHQLKANPATRQTLVMIMTGYGKHADILQGLSAGANEYCLKPFDMYILRQKITRLLSRMGHRLPA